MSMLRYERHRLIVELAARMRDARSRATTDSEALAALVRAYGAFAVERPAVYDAMFAMVTDLRFGPDAPQALRDAFAELVAVMGPFAGDEDVESFTETVWSALHGLAVLDRGERLRPGARADRLDILCRMVERGRASM